MLTFAFIDRLFTGRGGSKYDKYSGGAALFTKFEKYCNTPALLKYSSNSGERSFIYLANITARDCLKNAVAGTCAPKGICTFSPNFLSHALAAHGK